MEVVNIHRIRGEERTRRGRGRERELSHTMLARNQMKEFRRCIVDDVRAHDDRQGLRNDDSGEHILLRSKFQMHWLNI